MNRRRSISRAGWLLGLWLYLFCLVPLGHAAESSTENRFVLTATITVRNNGDTPLEPYQFRLSIPADDHLQQRLVSIETPQSPAYTIRRHENGVDRYLDLSWSVPARSVLEREVRYIVDVHPYDYQNGSFEPIEPPHPRFLAPSKYVESDAPEMAAIARKIEHEHATPEQRLRAAYRYPIEHLRYRTMAENEGALHGLRHGKGDCTEYAAIFIALARALGTPARMSSDFHFSKATRFSSPNHHAAEVYLDGRWIPVDPNLALDPTLGYGFGVGSNRKIVLKRGDSWVWSYAIPGLARGYRKAYVNTSIRWDVRRAD